MPFDWLRTNGAVMNVMVIVFVPLTVMLLRFMMGLQNAVHTKISKAEIRTTHITDLGIKLGKLLYVNRSDTHAPVLDDLRQRW
jgi:uncharacterized membrane protein YoaK (UPF0700 family)